MAICVSKQLQKLVGAVVMHTCRQSINVRYFPTYIAFTSTTAMKHQITRTTINTFYFNKLNILQLVSPNSLRNTPLHFSWDRSFVLVRYSRKSICMIYGFIIMHYTLDHRQNVKIKVNKNQTTFYNLIIDTLR